jgi:hypothetical protein
MDAQTITAATQLRALAAWPEIFHISMRSSISLQGKQGGTPFALENPLNRYNHPAQTIQIAQNGKAH